jgi:DNA polymerase elongation subunit (family B)
VRLHAYRGPTKPPAAVVAAKAMYEDPRAEPAHAERIPYCVVYGEPGARLIDMVVTPTVLTDSKGRRRLHAKYYITKQVTNHLFRLRRHIDIGRSQQASGDIVLEAKRASPYSSSNIHSHTNTHTIL